MVNTAGSALHGILGPSQLPLEPFWVAVPICRRCLVWFVPSCCWPCLEWLQWTVEWAAYMVHCRACHTYYAGPPLAMPLAPVELQLRFPHLSRENMRTNKHDCYLHFTLGKFSNKHASAVLYLCWFWKDTTIIYMTVSLMHFCSQHYMFFPLEIIFYVLKSLSS